MSNTEQPQTTEQINEWSEICDLTKVIYSITEEDEDEDVYDDSDNSTIPSYLVGGLDLDIGSDYDSDSDNSTILSYLLDNIDLDLHSDSEDEDEDEDDQVVPVSKLNAE